MARLGNVSALVLVAGTLTGCCHHRCDCCPCAATVEHFDQTYEVCDTGVCPDVGMLGNCCSESPQTCPVLGLFGRRPKTCCAHSAAHCFPMTMTSHGGDMQAMAPAVSQASWIAESECGCGKRHLAASTSHMPQSAGKQPVFAEGALEGPFRNPIRVQGSGERPSADGWAPARL